MGQPKKRTSARRTGMRRSHLVLKLAKAVNAKSPVKAYSTVRNTGTAKKLAAKQTTKATVKTETKPKAKVSKEDLTKAA